MEKYYIYEETIIFDYKLSIGTNNKFIVSIMNNIKEQNLINLLKEL